MWSWVFWFCFGVSINLMLFKKPNNMSSWQDSRVRRRRRALMRWKDYDVLSTDDERGMVKISCGFESYRLQCTVFFGSLPIFGLDCVLTCSEPNSGALESEPRPRFSDGPEFGCLVHTRVRMSFHTTPNQPDYPKKRSRVRLKRTKQLKCESTRRHNWLVLVFLYWEH